MTSIRRRAHLPHGYSATFTWDGTLAVEWSPAVPRIHSRRHFNKFFAAYQDARRDFFRDVATTIGGAVAVGDLRGEFEVIQPGTRH
jgi:hypothetical protein